MNELQEILFKEYVKNGYLEMWNNIEFPHIFDIAELSLINTEVSEAIEEIRGNNDLKKIGLECADIIIRTLNFMTRKGLDAKFYILKKHKKNLKRGLLHGKKA